MINQNTAHNYNQTGHNYKDTLFKRKSFQPNKKLLLSFSTFEQNNLELSIKH